LGSVIPQTAVRQLACTITVCRTSTNVPIATTQLRSTRNNVHSPQNARSQATNKLTETNNAGTETVSHRSAQLSLAVTFQPAAFLSQTNGIYNHLITSYHNFGSCIYLYISVSTQSIDIRWDMQFRQLEQKVLAPAHTQSLVHQHRSECNCAILSPAFLRHLSPRHADISRLCKVSAERTDQLPVHLSTLSRRILCKQ